MKKILITATKALLYFVGWTLLVSFIPVPDFENPAIWRFAAELIPFLCIIGISILFWLIEKRSVKIFKMYPIKWTRRAAEIPCCGHTETTAVP